ncbi:MAG: 30S ribosomal protein S20 [Patescibacteria group bacterium]
MPIKQAAIKALRQTKKRTVANRAVKERIKDTAKKIKKFLAEKKIDDAKKIVPLFSKIVDKAGRRHVIAKNRASRLKSWAMRQVNKTV